MMPRKNAQPTRTRLIPFILFWMVSCSQAPVPLINSVILVSAPATFPAVLALAEAFRHSFPNQPTILVDEKAATEAWQALNSGMAQGVVQSDGHALQHQTSSLGWIGLAIISAANSRNGALSQDQVQRLFLGLPDPGGSGALTARPHLYVYSSGTDLQELFNQTVLHDARPYPGATPVPGVWAMMEALQSDSNGIGFMPCLDVPDSVRIVPVDGHLPKYEEVADGKYPYRLPILITTTQAMPAVLRDFIGWSQSADGQGVLSKICDPGGT
jgi:hypothetical protein